MTTTATTPSIDGTAAWRLAEQLADVFRKADVADVFTNDLFLDGHPPFWRFQLAGVDSFASWLAGYASDGVDTTVVRAVPTKTGFVTELTGRHKEDGELMTDRKIILCEVRNGRIAALTIYCSGDWDAELRDRHARETVLLRP